MELTCRNCGSQKVTDTEQGTIAPFFLKRVHNVELLPVSRNIWNKLPQACRAIYNALSKTSLWKNSPWIRNGTIRISSLLTSKAKASIRICKACSFVGPTKEYPFEMLRELYLDYRSPTYDADRIRFEPSYETIKDKVGRTPEELRQRLANVDKFLASHIDIPSIKRLIDWGGGEGRFIPTLLRDKDVWILDVSTEALADPRYNRVDSIPDGLKFQFAQICHVLEHVSSPRQFLSEVISHIDPGGYIYVEVPQDRSDEELEELSSGTNSRPHCIHEHLNLFSPRSLTALATSLRLEIVSVQSNMLDFGWTKARVISGLYRKPSSP